MPVTPCPLPADALLTRYQEQDGAYTDAYVTAVSTDVGLYDYVEAFYATPLFRTEKALLRVAFAGKGRDWDACALRHGSDQFAAWSVEDRSTDQLLMCDAAGATRSWFRVTPRDTGTDLYFGSAVVPSAGTTDLPRLATALMGFHKLYSRALLASAAARVKRPFKPAS